MMWPHSAVHQALIHSIKYHTNAERQKHLTATATMTNDTQTSDCLWCALSQLLKLRQCT